MKILRFKLWPYLQSCTEELIEIDNSEKILRSKLKVGATMAN